MTGVQTCALPICFPVTIAKAIGEEAELVLIEAQLRKAALSGEDTQALKFYLERRAPSRFGRQVKQEAGEKTPEDLANLLEALKARTGG